MELGIYNIINDPLPQLNNLKSIQVNEEDFKYEEGIVNILNRELKMDKLSSEHIYTLSLTYNLTPKGIIQVSIGRCDGCEVNMKDLATGLLLTGAEQFMCFHNHPGGNKKISESDIELTEKYKQLGDLIGIKLIKHIMITRNYYMDCKGENKKEILFGKEVIV